MNFLISLCISACISCANMAASVTLDDCPSNLPRNRYLRAFGTSCYSFVISHEREFSAAERECEARRGHLVIVRNAQIQQFLYNTLKNDFHYNGVVWLGLTDQKSEGHYVWVDGSRATYTHWASGQPGLLGSLEDCAAMDVSKGGTWHDYPCQDILFVSNDHVFVCEYPVVIRTTTTTTVTTTPETTTDDDEQCTGHVLTGGSHQGAHGIGCVARGCCEGSLQIASLCAGNNNVCCFSRNTCGGVPRPRCLQCGDIDSQTPCTDDEVQQTVGTDCGADEPYCMIDIYRQSAQSPLTYYKRCVTEQSCALEWYQAYLQSDFCVHLDVEVPDILVCHLCCYGDLCNNGTSPSPDTLYTPVNGTTTTPTV